MFTQKELYPAVSDFAGQIKNIFRDKLKTIILFGSYAREEQDEGSDIDLMILVDIDKINLRNYRAKVVELVTEFEWNYNVIISPVVQNYDEFEKYKDASGFFKNVIKEGVSIGA
jgi:predicted nucleotidyltransferase